MSEAKFYATICTNGHVISSSEKDKQKFCSQCGAESISSCSYCDTPILGSSFSDFMYNVPYKRPDYCHNCGKPYPWTESALTNAILLIQEEDELSEQLKTSIVETLPDIITETPKTNLATIRFKKALASAGKFTAEGLRQFAIDFGCELAKKLLGINP